MCILLSLGRSLMISRYSRISHSPLLGARATFTVMTGLLLGGALLKMRTRCRADESGEKKRPQRLASETDEPMYTSWPPR